MNLILFESHELHEDKVQLTGRRASHIRKILGLRVGDTLRIGMVNGKTGTGKILFWDSKQVDIAVQLTADPPEGANIELILALPRPIMLQRIIKQATVFGVRHFHLIRSARVEKSFFQSPVLQPEKLHSLLLEGLEQAMDTRLPEITVYHRFKPFVEDVVPVLVGKGLLAHPTITGRLDQALATVDTKEKILLAVGPEGGWNNFELDCFLRQGFTGFTMGKRILHVDTAVVALLAQIQLLQEIHYN